MRDIDKMKSSKLNAEEIQKEIQFSPKAKAKSPEWIRHECTSVLKERNRIFGELTRAYNNHESVDGLGDNSKYGVVDIYSDEAREMDNVKQTVMKARQDIETTRKSRNSDFQSQKDIFAQEWKIMEEIMKQEGVEAVEIPHKD